MNDGNGKLEWGSDIKMDPLFQVALSHYICCEHEILEGGSDIKIEPYYLPFHCHSTYLTCIVASCPRATPQLVNFEKEK